MIKQKYPDAYDVHELVVFRAMPERSIQSFTQRRGILVAGRGKEPYASILSRLLLDHQSYMNLREYAYGEEYKSRISGFNLVDWTTPAKNLDDLYNDIMILRTRLSDINTSKKGLPLELSTPIVSEDSLFVQLAYNRVTPGRIELLSRSEELVDFTITSLGNHTWQVLCRPRYNQDVESLQKILGKMDKDVYQVIGMTLDDFPVGMRIGFFDRLLEHYTISSKTWKLREVVKISLKKPDSNKNDSLFDIEADTLDEAINSEDTRLVSISDLQSINQAALEGHNLRTNVFVQSCEHAGFYFPSMAFILENMISSEVIQVELRFKLSPKIFEVLLQSTGENTTMGERPITFSSERQKEILMEFWNTAHQLWREIHDGLPASIGANRQTSIKF